MRFMLPNKGDDPAGALDGKSFVYLRGDFFGAEAVLHIVNQSLDGNPRVTHDPLAGKPAGDLLDIRTLGPIHRPHHTQVRPVARLAKRQPRRGGVSSVPASSASAEPASRRRHWPAAP